MYAECEATRKVRARTGYYGPEHLARLHLIQELQANCYNLAAIKHLLSRTQQGSAEDVLGFARALGHTIVPTTPALAPLLLDGGASTTAAISGVAAPVRLELEAHGRIATRISGAMLWTH